MGSRFGLFKGEDFLNTVIRGECDYSFEELNRKLKLIEDWGGFEKTLEHARIDEKSQSWDGVEDYSAMLRSHLPKGPLPEEP